MAAGRIAQGPNALDKQWLEAEKFALASDNLPAVVVVNPDGSNISGGGGGGGGLAIVDEASWTAGTSTFTPSGGVFNDSATALTSGQQGTERLTPNRAAHANLRNNAGTEVGTSSTPLQVSLANTAANATAVKVDGSAVTQPVSAASLPLPTGASTAAKQPALGTAGTASADVITVQGIASMIALKVDGSAVTQPVSGTITAVGTSASLFTGQATSNSTTPVQIAGATSHPISNGMIVKSLSTNNASGLYVGLTGVSTTTGDYLEPGESRGYAVNNTNLLYIVCAGSTTDVVTFSAN